MKNPTPNLRTPASILIVDDDLDLRDTLKILLESEGFEVSSSANGRDALEALRSGPLPDLLLLDVGMPYTGGNEVLRRTQAEAGLRELPVIVLTAGAETIPTTIPPAHRLLRKPFDLEELLALIADALPARSKLSPGSCPG